MANVIENDFISDFHNLAGITPNEKRTHLYNLLNCYKEKQLQIDFSNLHPKTFLEGLLKLDAQIFYKRTQELYQVLLDENPIYINKILNITSPWFVREAFKHIDGQKLVNEVLPQLSYNSKLKILNKFVQHLNDNQKCDEYFECIKNRYGLFLASKMLSACSEDLIMMTVKEYKIEITARQLLTIIKTHPQLTEPLLEKLDQYNYKSSVADKYKIVFKYLLINEPQVFVKINSKYHPTINIGKHATKQLCREFQKEILSNAKDFCDKLNNKRLSRMLQTSQFIEYYSKSLPNSLSEFETNYDILLRRLQNLTNNITKFRVLTQSFHSVYDSEIWNHPKLVKEEIVVMMPFEERQVWLKNRTCPDNFSEPTWLSFMASSISIPLIQEKLTRTSNISDRKKLVVALVKTCANDDKNLAALLEVCQYMMKKHRNDIPDIHLIFLEQIISSFNLKKI